MARNPFSTPTVNDFDSIDAMIDHMRRNHPKFQEAYEDYAERFESLVARGKGRRIAARAEYRSDEACYDECARVAAARDIIAKHSL